MNTTRQSGTKVMPRNDNGEHNGYHSAQRCARHGFAQCDVLRDKDRLVFPPKLAVAPHGRNPPAIDTSKEQAGKTLVGQ